MPCYNPVRAALESLPDGKRGISFNRHSSGKGIHLPCGKCDGCLSERARQWAVRIVHEAKMHDENCFVTLTYDRQHLPVNGSLSVEACQLFLKRLRARISPVKIKFFLCGEYGERLERPHYHAILFGWNPPDKVLIKGSGELSLFSSFMLSAAWGNGFASVGQVSFDSAAYVANYTTKKIFGSKADAYYQGRKPEFLLMSRGGRKAGGIGKSWFDKFGSDVYPSDEVIVKGSPSRPPRFYDKLLDKVNPDMLIKIKDKRTSESEYFEFMVGSNDTLNLVQVDGPDEGPRRLAVRQAVFRARQALKSRSFEGG